MKSLPSFAQQWLETRLSKLPPRALQAASQELSERYRAQTPGRQLGGAHSIEAYLGARLPATYAVVAAVLDELKLRAPAWQPGSVLDLGAGPGTASMAVAEAFPELRDLLLFERESAMITAGRELFAAGPALLRQAVWRQGALPALPPFKADLTILSYVLNEMSPLARAQLIESLPTLSGTTIVIEPGTPEGYRHLLAVRTAMLAQGWQLWAPCPHALECPLPAHDWCHFAVRLPRSPLQRYLKQGSQNYEDEKFAYLILSREPAPQPAPNRILRHPLKLKGHLELRLCTPTGLAARTVAKSEDGYRRARKAEWGDSF